MTRKIKYFIAIWALLVVCGSGIAFSSELIERISKVVSPQIGEHGNVGAMVGIYDRGQVYYLPFGEVKKGSQKTPDEHTLFEIGSITKTFTGLLFAIALEKKSVAETDTIAQFRDEWRNQKTSDITLLELATHRSGLPRLMCNLHMKDPRSPYADYTEQDLIDSMRDDCPGWKREPLRPHPSNAIEYSNWGYALLGYILSLRERVGYPELLRREISGPLGLVDSTCELSASQLLRLAQGYDHVGRENPPWDRKILLGAGAIRSSASDLIRYATAYLHPDSFPGLAKGLRRSMKLIFPSHPDSMGCAWFITKAGNIRHSGGTGGYKSTIKIYPSKDLAVFYLTNTARHFDCFFEAVEQTTCHK